MQNLEEWSCTTSKEIIWAVMFYVFVNRSWAKAASSGACHRWRFSEWKLCFDSSSPTTHLCCEFNQQKHNISTLSNLIVSDNWWMLFPKLHFEAEIVFRINPLVITPAQNVMGILEEFFWRWFALYQCLTDRLAKIAFHGNTLLIWALDISHLNSLSVLPLA